MDHADSRSTTVKDAEVPSNLDPSDGDDMYAGISGLFGDDQWNEEVTDPNVKPLIIGEPSEDAGYDIRGPSENGQWMNEEVDLNVKPPIDGDLRDREGGSGRMPTDLPNRPPPVITNFSSPSESTDSSPVLAVSSHKSQTGPKSSTKDSQASQAKSMLQWLMMPLRWLSAGLMWLFETFIILPIRYLFGAETGKSKLNTSAAPVTSAHLQGARQEAHELPVQEVPESEKQALAATA